MKVDKEYQVLHHQLNKNVEFHRSYVGIAWMPIYTSSGKASKGIGLTLDILPTIADLVGKP